LVAALLGQAPSLDGNLSKKKQKNQSAHSGFFL